MTEVGDSFITVVLLIYNYQKAFFRYTTHKKEETILESISKPHPHDLNKPFMVPDKLIQFEARMKLRGNQFLEK